MIDPIPVIDAISNCPVSPPARIEGSRLVEEWIEKWETFPERNWRIEAVETPFYIQLEPKTIIVGQMDAIFNDGKPLQAEWKSRRAPKIKKDGTPYKGDTEEDWLEEIILGPQLSIYALAGREGCFLREDSGIYATSHYFMDVPRIMVRAAIKSKPPVIWPTNPMNGIFEFPTGVLDATRDALLSIAASIRGRKQRGTVPWQLMGYHCRPYGRECEFVGICKEHRHPATAPVSFHPTDPGFRVCAILGLDYRDADLVVLSASSVDEYFECAEKHRIKYHGHIAEEPSLDLQIGTALHTGLSAIYRQMF